MSKNVSKYFDKKTLEDVLQKVLCLPGVYVDREEFLTRELFTVCSAKQVTMAIAYNLYYADIPVKKIDYLAQNCIKKERLRATVISGVTGIPGGIAAVGMIPVDVTQQMVHMVRIIQKLCYLYGWESLYDPDDALNRETLDLILLFVGVMMGVEGTNAVLRKVSEAILADIGRNVAEKLLQKGIQYPIKKIIKRKVVGSILAEGSSKVIPMLGGALSAGMTYVSFKKMATRLQNQLKKCSVYGIAIQEKETDNG